MDTAQLLSHFPRAKHVLSLIDLAKSEDLGSGDVTSKLLIPEDKVGVATLLQKDVGVVCGLPLVEMICRAYDERLRVEQIPGFHMEIIEGRYSDQRRTPLVRMRGPLRSLLSAERIVLNFVQRLSGVATMTNRFVRRVEGTKAKILDTRKTTPGFRLLEKYAVLAGGGHNHRIGLYDGVLIKDNHIADVPVRDLAPFVERLWKQARAEAPGRMFEVEVDTLEQLGEVLKVDFTGIVLLDNMDCPRMEEAVRLRDAANRRGQIELEASGGVTLDTVRTIALTGVERISVGALTHSAPALDIGLDVEDA